MFRKRFISSLVLFVLFAPLLWFSHITYLLNAAVALLAAAAVYEALYATKYVEGKSLMVISIVFAVCMPFLPELNRKNMTAAFFAFTIVLVLTLLFTYGNFTFEHISVVFLISIIISYFFSTLIYVRQMPMGHFYIYLVFIGAWITDMGAYLCGRMFGKHKLVEHISPKKTIEGSVGGIILTTISFVICGMIDEKLFGASVNLVGLGVVGFFVSIIAQIGDLFASMIKRTFGVKDFGSIMPGHGGILDRFDSVIFVSPFIFIIFSLFPMIK
jgi:phosphatidate cytidylyltransferase